MNEISSQELDAVTGGFSMPIGAMPINNKIGFYTQQRNIDGTLMQRTLGPKGGVYPWRRAPLAPGEP